MRAKRNPRDTGEDLQTAQMHGSGHFQEVIRLKSRLWDFLIDLRLDWAESCGYEIFGFFANTFARIDA